MTPPILHITLPLLTTLLAPAIPTPSTSPDPILGKWLGTAGFPQDRVQIGLEIKANDKGELQAFLYQPVINFYGLDTGGTIQREGDTYTGSGLALACTLRDGKLDGTLTGAKVPITLERTEALPAETPIPDLPAGPAPKWKLALGSSIYAPAAIRDHTAYLGNTGGVFHAIKIEDGTLAWTFTAGRPIHGEALADESTISFVCDNGFLYHLDRATGRELWRYDLGDSHIPRILPHPAIYEYDYRAPKPLLVGNIIYVGAADGGFHAIDAASGARVWRTQTRGKIRADAIACEGNVLAGSWDGTLYAFDRASGAFTWTYDTKAPISSTPTFLPAIESTPVTSTEPSSLARILIGNRGSVLRSLNPADGVSQWRQLFWGSWVESTAIAATPFDGRLYIGSSDLRRVTCFDPSDGRVLWRTDVLGCPWGTPAITDARVYTGAVGSAGYIIRHLPGLLALDRATGAIIWRWVPPPAPGALQSGFAGGPAIDAPAADGQTLIIGGIDGTVYAFPCE